MANSTGIPPQTVGQIVILCNMLDLYYLSRAERDLGHYDSANHYLDMAEQCDATGHVSDQITPSLQEALQMERCSSAYYNERIREGYQACQQLIGHRYYGKLAFNNLHWYHPKLKLKVQDQQTSRTDNESHTESG